MALNPVATSVSANLAALKFSYLSTQPPVATDFEPRRQFSE